MAPVPAHEGQCCRGIGRVNRYLSTGWSRGGNPGSGQQVAIIPRDSEYKHICIHEYNMCFLHDKGEHSSSGLKEQEQN